LAGIRRLEHTKNHKVANHRKSVNTIWEMINEEGGQVRIFQGLAELGIRHFENALKELERVNIIEIVKIVYCFLGFVMEEDNLWMYE
jgi:predicted RNA-binding protein with EMAP domain